MATVYVYVGEPDDVVLKAAVVDDMMSLLGTIITESTVHMHNNHHQQFSLVKRYALDARDMLLLAKAQGMFP